MVSLGTKLVGAVPGDRKTERALHESFAHLRERGEWFRAEKELLDYIRDKAQAHEPDTESTQITIRLPVDLLSRIDELSERLSKPGFAVPRVKALRLAIFKGLEALETAENMSPEEISTAGADL